MADSLIDFGKIAQLSQNNIQNAISLGWLQQRDDQNEIRQQRADDMQAQQKAQLALDQQRLRQSATFKAFDEIDKLAASPQFATPIQQIDLRHTQANLLKTGLGLDIPMPSREEMVGAYEQFADNIKQYRQSADPSVRRASLENLILAAPQYGKTVLDDLKKAGDLDMQGEELMTKLELNKAKLQALNVQSGRTAMQQGLYAENLGALSQAMQVTKSPQFQAQFQKLQGLSPLAQQGYLKLNPQFQQAFSRALQLHKDKLGAVGPEFEKAFGEDAKPKYLAALDQQMEQMLQAKNDALEQHGAIPTELSEQIAGLEAVRKARGIQYEWMKDPFNKDKFTAFQKAQGNIKLLYDAAGKTLTGIQGERDSIAQTKLDAEQQEKLASDYAQEQYKGFLDKGYNENKAAVLAGKQTQAKYPETPYNADRLKAQRPLAETKIVMNQEKAESTAVGKEFGEIYTGLQKDAIKSASKIPKLERMAQLMEGVQTGRFAPTIMEVQAIADGLGIPVDKKLPAKQAFDALSKELALTIRDPSSGGGMPGALSDSDRQFVVDASPSLSKTPEGNRILIDIGIKLERRKQEVAKIARDYRKTHGQSDEGLFDAVQSYADSHPLFQRQAGRSQAPGASLGGPPAIQSDADYNKLPSGTVFVGPDGKQRRKP